MAKKAAHEPEPVEAVVVAAEPELVEVSAARQPFAWWPVAALSVLLLAFVATMVNVPGVSPLRPDAKAAYLEATPRLEGMDAITAPEPTVTPDPKSFAQKIEVILPPPPPPAAKGGGRKGGVASSGGGGGGALNTADAGAFCANINNQRQANGLSALSSCYATSARQSHANSMAATNPPSIWHQGDNIVGVAPGHTALINAFMNSAGHKAQILTASYTGAKVGCAWGQPPGFVPLLYCTADFF
jgi:hypothetical protein